MTLPASGPLTISAVEAELQLTAGTTLDLNDIRVRNLANSNVTGTQFSFSNLYGTVRDVPPTTWTATAVTTTYPTLYSFDNSLKPFVYYNGTQFNVFGPEFVTNTYYTYGVASTDGITWTLSPNTNLPYKSTSVTYPSNSVTTPIYSSTTGRYIMHTVKYVSSTQMQLIIYYNTSPNTATWGTLYTGSIVANFNTPLCSIAQGSYILYFSIAGYNTNIFGSSDGGSTWALSSTISNASPCDVRYYNGTFYLLTTYTAATSSGLTHNLYSSTNGTTWASVSNVYTTTAACNSVAFDISSTGVFAAAFNDGYVRTSNDGVTWTSRTITGISIAGSNNSLLKLALCWAGPKYLLLACSYSTATGIYLSRDIGGTWVKVDSMAADGFATTNPNPLGTVVAYHMSNNTVLKYSKYK